MAFATLKALLRSAPPARHTWITEGAGAAGRSRRFTVLPLGSPGPLAPGLYLFVRRQSDGARVPVYAGESGCIGERLIAHEALADALLIGACELHVLTLRADGNARRAAAERLIALYDPVLNRPAVRTRAAAL